MSRAIATALSVLFALAGALPVAAAEEVPPPAAPAGDVVPGEVVVGWRNPARAERVARGRGLALVANLGTPASDAHATVVSTHGRPVQTVAAELRADPAVAYAEPNYVFSLPKSEREAARAVGPVGAPTERGSVTGVPVSDPQTAGQYSLDQMRVRDAWARTTGASNLIAVLDTGVQSGHRDLRGRVVKGYDFVNNDTGASDDNGHGTWVAGIIASNANDGYGIAGISWTDRILPVKIMNANGTGTTSDLAAGIIWAADKGADVINLSVGGFPYSHAVQNAVDHAWSKGAVLVGAAGNTGRPEEYYPASYERVVSVSATQPLDEFSHWSSYGPKVDVSAPGSSVLTTNCVAASCPHPEWGSHTYISGTSFATPNVSAVVALIRAKYPGMSPSGVVKRLFATVDDLGYAGRDDRYGLGRVNALRAVGKAVAPPAPSAGDSFEANNALSVADRLNLGRDARPSIYPAGDQDWFKVKVPRAGRLDVRVTGVVDSWAYPWHQSGLPVDPIVALYDRNGTLLLRVDKEWESGVEVARLAVSKATTIWVRVTNFYANGNRNPYRIRPTFVDTVAPVATFTVPAAGATDVTQWVVPTATFNEAVTNVSASTVRLRNMATLALVPASVSYDAASRTVRLTPSTRLDGHATYRFELTKAITDVAGNPLATTRRSFTTSLYAFRDIQGTPNAAEIQWLASRRLIPGCGSERFCPNSNANRTITAVVLARALALPPTSVDFFSDDEGARHEDAFNRVAATGAITPCGVRAFCPRATIRRGEMAQIIARAFDLPATDLDPFTDDDGKPYEDAVNRVAAAGLMTSCGSGKFCPGAYVRRQELADIVYHALKD